MITQAKIANCLSVIKGFERNHPETDFSRQVQALNSAISATTTARSLAELLGIEGSSARAYFAGFAKVFLGDFTYTGRKKNRRQTP